MRRDPSLSLKGALQILGKYESDYITRLDRLLGGAILAAGAGAQLAVLGGPSVAPLAVLAPIWGWIGPKREAVGLIGTISGRIANRIDGVEGLERRQLIYAAHTTISIAAFFEAFNNAIGKELAEALDISDEEKLSVLSHDKLQGGNLLDLIYSSDVPTPSPARGFEENISEMRRWAIRLALQLNEHLGGLQAWDSSKRQVPLPTSNSVVDAAIERYRSLYLKVASEVPEFALWAFLGEHAATRTAIQNSNRAIRSALDENSKALGHVGSLLRRASEGKYAAMTPLREAVSRANQSRLHQSIAKGKIVPSIDRSPLFPSLEHQFIMPCFKVVSIGGAQDLPANEHWWDANEVRNDLDTYLAAYISTNNAIRLPLLLLGHPGAGKSVVSRVIAAQLPPQEYVVVYVPLRSVVATAPILDQVQQALDQSTNRRVEWHSLSDQCGEAVRVVILDGLDELLQASQLDRHSYMDEISAFQQIEMDQRRPLIVIVTSRTVVADRIDIPAGTTVVKLEEFSSLQTEEWLKLWSAWNSDAITNGAVRPLGLEDALAQPDISSQPLLLMMLAVYTADRDNPGLGAGLSKSELYGQLLVSFAKREVSKDPSCSHDLHAQKEGIANHLNRLAIAALAMFNRSSQNIAELDLHNDLVALKYDLANDVFLRHDEGKRILGEFFFVHSAEAAVRRPLGSLAPSGRVSSDRLKVDRSYEFLHSTFAEFLTARMTIEVLRDITDAAYGGNRGDREPNDDFLYAILSHKPIASRKSSLMFASELFKAIPANEQDSVRKVISALIQTHRQKNRVDAYAQYRPTRLDVIRQIAAYSANLVALAALFSPSGVNLKDLFAGSDVVLEWRSIVLSWKAGLDPESLQATFAAIKLDPRTLIVRSTDLDDQKRANDGIELYRAMGDGTQIRRERFGLAVADGEIFFDGPDWADATVSSGLRIVARSEPHILLAPPPLDASHDDVQRVKECIEFVLRSSSNILDNQGAKLIVEYLLDITESPDPVALLCAIFWHPNMLVEVPRIARRSLYADRTADLHLILAISKQRMNSTRQQYQWLAREEQVLESDHSTMPRLELGQIERLVVSLTERTGGSFIRLDDAAVDDDARVFVRPVIAYAHRQRRR